MHILGIIFDWIFPPSDKEKCVRSLSPAQIRTLYKHTRIKNTEILTTYQNSNIRALVHEAKFHNNERAQILLSILMQKYLENHTANYDVIIPIPLSKKRLRKRGHNQVLSILKNVTPDDVAAARYNVLERTKDTRPQTDLVKEKRINNMKGAFEVSNPELIKGRRVLLVDDVMTTGATLNAAKAKLLQHSPSSVTCLAIAH